MRQSLAFLAITWVPIVALELLRAVQGEDFALLRNVSVHARFLVAMPLLFAAEESLHRLCAQAITAFAQGRFAYGDAGDPTVPLVQRALKWTHSPVVEMALALACFGTQIVVWLTTGKVGILPQAVIEAGLSPGHVWYAFFSVPLVNFLLLRLAYRWGVWSWVLYRFSRWELRVEPTHPDNAGGLAHLAEPTLGFSLVLAAIAAVFASVWVDRILQEGLRATSFSDEFSVVVLLGEIWALAPLTAFSGRLLQTRLAGLIDYGQLALRYTRAFQRRWVDSRDEDGLLGTSDIQSLADLSNSYEIIEKMRIVPFRLRHVIMVFAAIAAPMLPLVLTEVPMHALLSQAGRTLLGGLPP